MIAVKIGVQYFYQSYLLFLLISCLFLTFFLLFSYFSSYLFAWFGLYLDHGFQVFSGKLFINEVEKDLRLKKLGIDPFLLSV